MSADILSPRHNSELQKLDDTLKLLSRVSLSLRTSVEVKPNQNRTVLKETGLNAERNRYRFADRSSDLIGCRKLNQPRAGRVTKKWVKLCGVSEI